MYALMGLKLWVLTIHVCTEDYLKQTSFARRKLISWAQTIVHLNKNKTKLALK